MKNRILVIDDDKDVCEVLARNLAEEGYDIAYELQGMDGVIQLRHSEFDAVILDLKLPDMYGTEVMKKIRAVNREIPIIILTGYPSLDSAIETIRYQGVDYIKKPFDIEELRKILHKALDSKRLIPASKLIKLKGIGKKVREIRKKRKWSLDVLADKTGLSKSFLSKMERAKRFPRLNTLQKIAKVLEVDVQFFLS